MPHHHAPIGPSSQTAIFNVKPGCQKQGNNDQLLLSSGSSKDLSNSNLNSSNVSTYMNNSMSSMQSSSPDISNISSGGDSSSLLNITNSYLNSVNNIGGVQILSDQNQQPNQPITNHSLQSEFLSATNILGGAANNQSLSSLMSNDQMMQSNQIMAQNHNVIDQEFKTTFQNNNASNQNRQIIVPSSTGVVQSSQNFQQPKISTSTPKAGERSSGSEGSSLSGVAAFSISAINSSRSSKLSSQPSIIVSSFNNENLAVSNSSLMLPMVLSSGSPSNNILKPMTRLFLNDLSARSATQPATNTIVTNSRSNAIFSNASSSNIAEVQNPCPISMNKLANQLVLIGQTILQNNDGNILILSNGNILQNSGQQRGLQLPILINHNGIQLIVRPTGAPTNPVILNSIPQIILNGQQTWANGEINNATTAISSPAPTPQPPAQAFALNGQTYVMPQLGPQSMATSSPPRSITPSQFPVLRFISPQVSKI